jgi:protein TonB
MNRLNLLLGAILTIALIAGVAYYGEITGHFHAQPPPKPEPPPALPTFTVTPDPVEVPDPNSARPQARQDVAAPPVIPDAPQPPRPDSFTVPLEPPPVSFDRNMRVIPPGGGGGGNTSPVFTIDQLEQPPVPRVRVSPVYPQGMRSQGISGEVLVDFIVDPSGNVRNPVAAHSSRSDFEEPACRAVGKWKFTSGIKGGRAVFVHMQVPIVFTLKGGD